MSTHKQDFTQLQYEFAAHIRNPELHTKPDGVEDRRMNIYRSCFSTMLTVLSAVVSRY